MVNAPSRRLMLLAAGVVLAAGSLAAQPPMRGLPAPATQTTAEADGAGNALTDSKEDEALRTAKDSSGEGSDSSAGSERSDFASLPTESGQPGDPMPPRAPSLVVDEISVS